MSKVQTNQVGYAVQRQTRTITKKEAFLAAFESCGTISYAIAAIGIGRKSHYNWLKKDPAYGKKFRAIQEEVAKKLEQEAFWKTLEPSFPQRKRKYQYGKDEASARAAARKRDGGACRVCGFNLHVNVHHIVGRRDGGPSVLHNLITLCPNDHALADKGLISRDALLALIA